MFYLYLVQNFFFHWTLRNKLIVIIIIITDWGEAADEGKAWVAQHYYNHYYRLGGVMAVQGKARVRMSIGEVLAGEDCQTSSVIG